MQLIFLHIPKASGTTFYSVLDRYYREEESFEIKVASFEEDMKFFKSDRLVKSKIKLLKGHIPFGLHSYYESDDVRYITFLREPVERIISHYNYVLNTPQHYLYKTVMGNKMSLEDYALSDLSVELDNGQARMIAGISELPINSCGDDLLQTAKKNLQEKFIAFGITEKFDESLVLFRRKLSWNIYPFYKKLNVGKNGKSEITEAVRKKIADRNAVDCALYKWTLEQFNAELKLVPDFEKELEILQAGNVIFEKEYESGMKSGYEKGYKEGLVSGQEDLIKKYPLLRFLRKIKNKFNS